MSRGSTAAILLALATPALAHHSLTGLYERSRETALNGVVSEFRFINPHPVLVIDVRDDDEQLLSWQLEMDNRRELERIGMSADTFAVGDHVFVRGSLSLRNPQAIYLWRLDRPADGFWYEQRGSRPYTGVSEP